MRKLLLMLSLILLTVMPAAAQDDGQLVTIAEVVTAANNAEEPEFTTLMLALEAANPALLETLADENATVTVFAPTDEAFNMLLDTLELTADDLLQQTELLNEVLGYHIIPAEYSAATIAELDGALAGTFLTGESLAIALDDNDTLTVDDATVLETDLFASNGIVHVIDTVLLPATEEDIDDDIAAEDATLAEIVIDNAENANEFTTLLETVQAAEPRILEALTDGGPFTVFAPTDAAFIGALEELGLTTDELLADTERLTFILAYHILPGVFNAEDIITEAASAEAATIRVATLLPGITLDLGIDGDAVTVSYAVVTTPDVTASNGIIHVIDEVLIPPL